MTLQEIDGVSAVKNVRHCINILPQAIVWIIEANAVDQ